MRVRVHRTVIVAHEPAVAVALPIEIKVHVKAVFQRHTRAVPLGDERGLGILTSSISRILRQILQVYFLFLVSFFTRLDAISTRKPSQPMSSQNRMTSFMASTVATQAGSSVGFCHFWLIFP